MAGPAAAIELRRLRDLDVEDGAGQRRAIGAGSGLVRAGRHFHVIADDSPHLASFAAGSTAPGRLTPLLPGVGDAWPLAKAQKPDFEALALLPPSPRRPHGALLAMGAGSTEARRRGALIALDASGGPGGTSAVDLGPTLFAPLLGVFPQTNIEGALVVGSRLLLFHRANIGDPRNAVALFALDGALAALEGGAPPAAPEIAFVDLGSAGGVPLGFTDACLCGEAIVFTAVAERTANAYDDGAVVAACLGVLSGAGKVLARWPLSPLLKYEGVEVVETAGGRDVWLVTDADDPASRSGLYAGRLPRVGSASRRSSGGVAVAPPSSPR